jgi:predicted RNase H-like nuclease (RuvC/YqgF family)
MTTELWAALIAAVLGGGGLGAVIVNAIANRKKIQADCVATLSQAYETRINALNERADKLAAKVDLLEAQVSGLRSALSDREALIVNLQRENADLQTQVDKLSKAVNGRDKRIRELERQVADLTERLNAMGDADGSN